MQWLTAILAFATTMLIFAVIVTTLVETVHRALGSRTIGLEVMLQHFYDHVLKPHLATDEPKLAKDEFVKLMTSVRAPSSKNAGGGKDATTASRWSFKRLSSLPTETFMERLGASPFSDLIKGASEDEKKLLKDIAQKFESFGEESGLHFESKARLWSVVIAIFVAWTFYVHPYDLIQTYLKEPEAAVRVAELADSSMDEYGRLLGEADKLRTEQGKSGDETSPVTSADLDQLFTTLRDDLDKARGKVDQLSKAGAPVGWPDDPEKVVCDEGSLLTFCYPTRAKDGFWLLMGGLLIGLGAPFWARLIKQLSQAQNVSKNIANILKPQNQQQAGAPQTAAVPDQNPVTSEAFMAAAGARASVAAANK